MDILELQLYYYDKMIVKIVKFSFIVDKEYLIYDIIVRVFW